MLAGVPGAFIIWYGRIYNAASYDRAITFMCYFLGSAIHVGFCVWASIRKTSPSLAPNAMPCDVAVPLTTLGGDESSFAGFLEVFDKFDKAQWLGVFYLLGFVLWVGNAALSIFVWQQVQISERLAFLDRLRAMPVCRPCEISVGVGVLSRYRVKRKRLPVVPF